MGVQVPEAERNGELFAKYELIPLDFDLSSGEAALEGLTSAQLAAVRFHPAATPDLILAAEDIFFGRRERDFAAGLSLPSAASTETPVNAPSVPPVVPSAAPIPPAPILPEAIAPEQPAPASGPLAPTLPVPPVVPQQVAPTATNLPLPVGLPGISAYTDVVPPAFAAAQPASHTPAKPKSRLPPTVLHSAHVQPPLMVEAQPKEENERKVRETERERERPVEREMTPGTKQREKEREEYKKSRSVNGRRTGLQTSTSETASNNASLEDGYELAYVAAQEAAEPGKERTLASFIYP
ncbi:hypothetical protein Rt10032_c21g6435 [Rhodotorula toruloides]|uniref:Uncharacterized protein n=1 Tax=Rhodotorula toruloides TaxID=5286 RepID=A0A511KPX6_RHOTO|nr:hypothetical protein Rt10032_c21g6435 [Rhodotorula toruloides]